LIRQLKLGGTLSCAVLLCVGSSLAQSAEPEPEPAASAASSQVSVQAQDRFAEGVAAYEQSRFADAVALFREADRLAPSPLLSLNVARVYERMRDDRSALGAYREYLRRLPEAEDRAEVQGRVDELELTLEQLGVQQLSVLSTPAGAALVIDGQPRGVTPWTGELAPGSHQLVLSSSGHQDAARDIELPRVDALDVIVSLQPLAPSPTPDASAPSPRSPVAPAKPGAALAPSDFRETRAVPSVLSWALFGGSAALLISSAALELSRRDLEGEARRSQIQIEHKQKFDAMQDRQAVSRVLLGAGLLTGLLGAGSLYLDLDQGSPSAIVRPSALGMACAPSECLLHAQGRW
jgi:tetratricopeptide (TPR) repeat protein